MNIRIYGYTSCNDVCGYENFDVGKYRASYFMVKWFDSYLICKLVINFVENTLNAIENSFLNALFTFTKVCKHLQIHDGTF